MLIFFEISPLLTDDICITAPNRRHLPALGVVSIAERVLIPPNLQPGIAEAKFFCLQQTIMSRSKLGKGRKKEIDQQDRISQLPDEVIVSILSSLSLKEALATSILSSRWVHLWKFTTRLNFDATKALMPMAQNLYSIKEENDKYVKWVNQILPSHKSSTLEEFRVWFDLSNIYQNHIDNWLKFVLSKKVQRLELNFLEYGFQIRDFDCCYTFPFNFVSGSSGPPKLYDIGIYSCTFGCSESLRELSLSCVNVTGGVIQHFLSNCPLLERLVVTGSGITDLEVSSPSPNLRYLEISYCYDLDVLKICNTNLVSVNCWGIKSCVLLNNPSLVEVWLGYANLVAAFSPKPSGFLSQLESLHLCTAYGTTNMVLQSCPQLPRLKQLEVSFSVQKDGSLLGFSSLVKAAPCLQNFVMELNDFRAFKNGNTTSVEEPPSHPHDQLKTVELKGYYGATNNLEVLMYFLKNVLALEEIVIDPRTPLIDPMIPLSDFWIEKEEAARKLAKQQIEGISHLASHVKISIL